MRKFVLLACVMALAVVGCGSSNDAQHQTDSAVNAEIAGRQPYVPHNNVEFNNYNDAQKLYDDPSTIIWCTAFPQSSTAPLITVPIAGKLTSSSTTLRPPDVVHNGSGDTEDVLPNTSVDGLYHPNPAPYRYGFTPGGQYFDFFNMPTVCTTQPLEFQRQSLAVKVDQGLSRADAQAQAALRSGDKAKAQQILEAAAGQ